MKVYKTRISLIMSMFIIIVSFAPMLFVGEVAVPVLVTVAITDAVVFLFFFGIKYVIDGDVLKVYSFWGIHEDIAISSITKIEKSRCMLSAPAASLDRLAVHYNKHDVTYISPRNQANFLEEIKKINPEVIVVF